MFTLKKYQKASLDVLKNYLELARFKGAKQALLDIERAKQHAANAKGEHMLVSDRWDLNVEIEGGEL